MNFVAIDVETANPEMASICQIGIAEFRNGSISNEWVSYVDPENYFDSVNISIHGIDEKTVKGFKNYKQIAGTINDFLDHNVIVCHTHFDRVAIAQVCDRYGIRKPNGVWLDSAISVW